MRIFSTRKAYLKWRLSLPAREKVGFVPTMGALHRGHLSLVQKSLGQSSRTVVSIFVNPTQFGPKEDFAKYPRMERQDLKLLREQGVDAVFIPSVSEIYPQGSGSKVIPRASLTEMMEGKFRPGHFEGVATVVLKLFEIVRPTFAYFGEKDFQQVRVIEAMVEDFSLSVQVIRCKTVREESGLALSSRNSYLSRSDRAKAASLYLALKTSKNPKLAKDVLRKNGFRVQYLEVWSNDLERPSKTSCGRWLVSTFFGGVRLIDNLLRD